MDYPKKLYVERFFEDFSAYLDHVCKTSKWTKNSFRTSHT